MASEKLLTALNEQMNYEIYSAHIYLAMAGQVADFGFSGFENFYIQQYLEELFHARKLFNFINQQGGRVTVKGFEDPVNEYDSLVDILEESLRHEKIVTKKIYNLLDIATEEREHKTISFLHWYVDEQVEEEETFDNLIKKAKVVKDSGLYLLDQELASRSFSEPAAE